MDYNYDCLKIQGIRVGLGFGLANLKLMKQGGDVLQPLGLGAMGHLVQCQNERGYLVKHVCRLVWAGGEF